jgi:hypothetical protein
MFKPSASKLKELRSGREIPIRFAGVDVTEVRRQQSEPGLCIALVAIAVEKRTHSEAVPHVVDSRSSAARPRLETGTLRQLAKRALDVTIEESGARA